MIQFCCCFEGEYNWLLRLWNARLAQGGGGGGGLCGQCPGARGPPEIPNYYYFIRYLCMTINHVPNTQNIARVS